MANFTWPTLAVTATAGPINFVKNAVNTNVSEDTVTPANTIPLPVKVLDASGVIVGFATAAKQDTGNTSLASVDTKLSSQATAAKQDTGNTSLASIDTKLTSQSTAANQATANTTLSSIDTKVTGLATSAKQDAEAVLVGAVTEAAPASDTASSGLNGRLQRIAQRLTSLIALIPASLGQKTMANSFAVTISSDQSAVPISGSISATFGLATAFTRAMINLSAASATLVLAANASRKGLTLQNTTPNYIWLGSSTVTATGANIGLMVPPGATVQWTNTAAVYAYSTPATTGDSGVFYMEET